jgi:hypothetical protein
MEISTPNIQEKLGTKSWVHKLTILLGRDPFLPGLDYNAKILNLPDREASAKNLFLGLLVDPKEMKKAQKLGLI